jgi:hypothetical protein
MSCLPPYRLTPDRGTGAACASSGECRGGLAGLLSGRPCDPRAFRRVYPDRWAKFLRSHFRNSLEIAVFFDVDEKTARQWLNGVNAPQAWVVSFAVVSIPGAVAALMEAA